MVGKFNQKYQVSSFFVGGEGEAEVTNSCKHVFGGDGINQKKGHLWMIGLQKKDRQELHSIFEGMYKK